MVLPRLLPQLDRLYIFFDKYPAVPPEFAGHPKIVALHPSRDGNLLSCGKFLAIRAHGEPCLFFGFDDDILYPADYVEMLTRALRRHHFHAAVGFHATIFRPPHDSYRRDRVIFHFAQPINIDCSVDELGTGTIAFATPTLRIDPTEWSERNMGDLMVAIAAEEQGVPKLAVRRPRNYLRPIAETQSDSLYRRLIDDDSRETAVMARALRDHPQAWQGKDFAEAAALADQVKRLRRSFPAFRWPLRQRVS